MMDKLYYYDNGTEHKDFYTNMSGFVLGVQITCKNIPEPLLYRSCDGLPCGLDACYIRSQRSVHTAVFELIINQI